MNLSGLLPLITGAGGALVVLTLGLALFLTGKLHSDSEFQRVLDENKDMKSALATERQVSNELAKTGGVTNKLIGALVDVATDRHHELTGQHRPKGAGLTPDDLGL